VVAARTWSPNPRETSFAAHGESCRIDLMVTAEDDGNFTWSILVNSTCSTSVKANEQPTAQPAAQTHKPPTHWLEVFRREERCCNGHVQSRPDFLDKRLLPDFLDNHDSGDAGGVGALISMSVQDGNIDPGLFASPVTRYCVEVLNVTISGTTTTTHDSKPVDSPYATEPADSCLAAEPADSCPSASPA
jgi:hypothetical protein